LTFPPQEFSPPPGEGKLTLSQAERRLAEAIERYALEIFEAVTARAEEEAEPEVIGFGEPDERP
jgi:hypothetical protein